MYTPFVLLSIFFGFSLAKLYHVDSPSCEPERLIRCLRRTARSIGLTFTPDGLYPKRFSDFTDFIQRVYGIEPDSATSAELCRRGSYLFMTCIGDQIASCLSVQVMMDVLGYDLENAQMYRARLSGFTVACAEIIEGRTKQYHPTCPVDTSSGSVAFPDMTQGCCRGYWICGKDESDNGSGNFLWRAVCPPNMAIAKDYSNKCEHYSNYRNGNNGNSCTPPRACLKLNPFAKPFGILKYNG